MDLCLAVSVDADNPVAHDLRLVNGDLVWLGQVEGLETLEEVAQRFRVRLQFWKGEWFQDAREGVPYRDKVLTKNPSRQTVIAIFSNIIRTTPGVAALQRLDYSLDNATRELSLVWSCLLNDGRVFSSADFGPFLVEA